MTKSMLFRLVLAGMTVLAFQRVNAGSAVAMEIHHGNMATAYGGPVEREKQRALQRARQLYGSDVRLIAATDVTGYGAIAVARKGNKAVNGIALGQPSLGEAERLAIQQCLKAGGTNPQVRWTFKG